ncbi:hypothetical protein BGZ99_001732, partial [Dissophora globulifera]
MSTAAFLARYNIVKQVVPSSAPHFKLACNTYRQIPTSAAAATVPAGAAPAPPLIFTHANGISKEMCEPVLARMDPRWTTSDIYAFDCRNHGDSAVLNKDILEKQFDWYWYAQDILRIVDNYNLKKPIGVGHSILAECLRPGTFSAIVAIEPTMFPKTIFINAPFDDNPMAHSTLKRCDTWKDRNEARVKLPQKAFFRNWHPEILDIYLEHGMVDAVDKDGNSVVTLKTPKFQEAITYATQGNAVSDAFDRLNEVAIPVHIIAGEISDINPPELAVMKRDRCQQGTLETVKGAGHLVCLEKPQET